MSPGVRVFECRKSQIRDANARVPETTRRMQSMETKRITQRKSHISESRLSHGNKKSYYVTNKEAQCNPIQRMELKVRVCEALLVLSVTQTCLFDVYKCLMQGLTCLRGCIKSRVETITTTQHFYTLMHPFVQKTAHKNNKNKDKPRYWCLLSNEGDASLFLRSCEKT